MYQENQNRKTSRTAQQNQKTSRFPFIVAGLWFPFIMGIIYSFVMHSSSPFFAKLFYGFLCGFTFIPFVLPFSLLVFAYFLPKFSFYIGARRIFMHKTSSPNKSKNPSRVFRGTLRLVFAFCPFLRHFQNRSIPGAAVKSA